MMNCEMRSRLSELASTGCSSRYWSNLVIRLVHSTNSLVYSLSCLVGPPTEGGKNAGWDEEAIAWFVIGVARCVTLVTSSLFPRIERKWQHENKFL